MSPVRKPTCIPFLRKPKPPAGPVVLMLCRFYPPRGTCFYGVLSAVRAGVSSKPQVMNFSCTQPRTPWNSTS